MKSKTPEELRLMREAGRIVALVHQKMAEIIQPGITTKALDDVARQIILEAGATPSFLNYQGFPASICASVNDVVIHGIPDHRVLNEGDMISIDVGACYKGYHGDSAWTYAVGKVSREVQTLMETAKQALFQGLSKARAGARLTDISHAIGTYLEENNCSTPEQYTGHGIGSHLHEKPAVFNYGLQGRGPLLKKGMTIAVEPMVIAGKRQVDTLQDGWTVVTRDHSLAAHYEHTIVITDDGYEILTQL
ncbi:Methionine aminopeptidase 1 [Clostridiales bacterium CHKCI006]|nr:Methionine aminopeptidase 1 [Clostridiales bacterium CHKCI006]